MALEDDYRKYAIKKIIIIFLGFDDITGLEKFMDETYLDTATTVFAERKIKAWKENQKKTKSVSIPEKVIEYFFPLNKSGSMKGYPVKSYPEDFRPVDLLYQEPDIMVADEKKAKNLGDDLSQKF